MNQTSKSTPFASADRDRKPKTNHAVWLLSLIVCLFGFGSGSVYAQAVVDFDPANASAVTEGNTLTLNILTSGPAGVCDVTVFTTDGSAQSPADFTSFSQTLSINGSASVNLTTIIDALPEGSELLTVELAEPDLAPLTACTLGTNISNTITIQDAGTHTVEFTASSFNASEGSSALAEVTASAPRRPGL